MGWKRNLLLCWAVTAMLTATGTENLLRNPDFQNNGADWQLLRGAPVSAKNSPVTFADGTMNANLIQAARSNRGVFQLAQPIKLDRAKQYRVAFSATVTSPAEIMVSYRTSRNPKRNLGLANILKLQKGTHSYDFIFSPVENTDDSSEFALQLGTIMGKFSISQLSLSEFNSIPAKLGDTWLVQYADGKKRTVRVPFHAQPGYRHQIDLRRQKGADSDAVAVITHSFESDRDGWMHTGFSADWFMKINLNGKEIYSSWETGNGSNSFSTSDHAIYMPVRKGLNTLKVEVRSGSAGWRFVWGIPEKPIRYTAGKEWQPVDMSSVQIQPGTALDMTPYIAAPAGKFGRTTVGKNGLLEFANRPGEPVRLHGYSSGIPENVWRDCSDEEFRQRATAFAKATRRQGYNLFRMHGLDQWICLDSKEDMAISPKYLDRWDYMISEFKKEGVYVQFVILSFNLYSRANGYGETFAKRNMHKMMLYMGGEWERERFRYGATTLLNHVNPYTKLAWKDDPTIAIVEYYNEEYLGMARYTEAAKSFPEDHKFVLKVWNNWLSKRYADVPRDQWPASLRKTGLGNAAIPGAKDALINDYSIFCFEKIKETNRWCDELIRQTGYKGLTTENSALLLSSAAAGWETLQVVDNHVYYCHPSDWARPGSRVGQASAVGDSAGYFRNLAGGKLAGRPQFVGEFNFCFWNPYQHESGLVFNAYAAYQNFSSLAIHSHPVHLYQGNSAIGNFSSTSPVLRASQFLSNMLFLRGDVTPSPKLVTLTVPKSFLTSDGNGSKAVSSEQTKVALMSGFALAFPWASTPQGITPGRKPDLAILPTGAADVETHGWYTNVIATQDKKFSLSQTVAAMKKAGVLPADNQSDPARGVFQSDTGEITLRSREKLLKVVTPRTEAVTLLKSKREPLNALTVETSSVDACVGLSSLDGRELAKSKRMVLVYSTEMVNTDMEVSGSRSTLIKLGRLPGLMRTGELYLTLRTEGRNFKLYALKIDGTRGEELPLANENGKLSIRFDTSKLKNGPTPFFELVRE